MGALMYIELVLVAPFVLATPGAMSPPIETLVQASQPTLTTDILLADLGHEVALAIEHQRDLSPVALVRIDVGSGLPAAMADELRMALSNALTRSSGVREVKCFACMRLDVKFEDDALVLSRGESALVELIALARESGAKSFLFLTLMRITRDHTEHLALTARWVRAHDASLALVRTFESDASRAGLGINPNRLETAEVRKAAYRAAIPARNGLGQVVAWGYIRIPVHSEFGDLSVNGLMLTYRLSLVSGDLPSLSFGVQVGGFIDPTFDDVFTRLSGRPGGSFDAPMSGGLATCVVGYRLPIRDLRFPRIRLIVEGGGFLGGSLGNEPIIGGALEASLRHRLGLRVALIHFGESDLGPLYQAEVKMGGLAYMVGAALNWE
jgi:hypothetical protein